MWLMHLSDDNTVILTHESLSRFEADLLANHHIMAYRDECHDSDVYITGLEWLPKKA